jgi:hypothetical protein
MYHIVDGEKPHNICTEIALVNMLYETDPETALFNYQLAQNHKNINDDFEYYKRCVLRLTNLLKSKKKKLYLYIHPILEHSYYIINRKTILDEFNAFKSFIDSKTVNNFGLFFILVRNKHNENISEVVEISDNHAIYLLYCNENFYRWWHSFLRRLPLRNKRAYSYITNTYN